MKFFNKLQICLTLVLVLFAISCSGREINSGKLQERNGIYYAINEEDPYSGTVIDMYENGQMNLKKSFKDGILDGTYKSWFRDGQKHYTKKYSKGKPDGVFIEWTSDGQKISEISYKDGVLSGSYRTWYENGQKKEDGTYVLGKQDGDWSYWEGNGKKTKEFEFENGVLKSLTREGKKVKLGELKDIDGNIYATIKIGNQEWMAENLKVTHYRNGDPIPNVTNISEWRNFKNGEYCAYDNSSANIETYGLLYNWYAVDDKRNIAPKGWHVPTHKEWKELEKYLGEKAGSKLKATNAVTNHGNGTNESGFKALPGGSRHVYGSFMYIGRFGYWWSSTESRGRHAWFCTLEFLEFSSQCVSYSCYTQSNGCSVRLVRD